MIRILLVDDIKDNIVVLDMLIEEYMEDDDIQDYEIVSTTNPREGIEIALSQNIDIIFGYYDAQN